MQKRDYKDMTEKSINKLSVSNGLKKSLPALYRRGFYPPRICEQPCISGDRLVGVVNNTRCGEIISRHRSAADM